MRVCCNVIFVNHQARAISIVDIYIARSLKTEGDLAYCRRGVLVYIDIYIGCVRTCWDLTCVVPTFRTPQWEHKSGAENYFPIDFDLAN